MDPCLRARPQASPAKSRKESGVLRTSIDLGGRPGAALLLCGALVTLPLLLIHGTPIASAARPPGPSHHQVDAPSPRASATAPGRRPPSRGGPAPSSGVVPATGTTAGTPPPTTSRSWPEQAGASEVVDRVATTTTTTPPPTTTTTSPPVAASPGAIHYGQVTYYAHPAGTCASPWLAFGTVVDVTNPANGYTVSCVVNDREADTSRAIDLATATFAELAPLSQGVIDAVLHW